MINCKICGLNFNSIRSIGKHLWNSHKEITKENYYNLYIGTISNICECGNIKKFRNLGEGYRNHCSKKCSDFYVDRTRVNLGRKQSKETIDKRIKNTDQTKKTKTRENTCLQRYGVKNTYMLPEVQAKSLAKTKGSKQPRKEGQQEKIIEAKRKNCTLAHTQETKDKISKSIHQLYQSENPPITISYAKHKHYKSGHFNGMYYRSSYELKFLEFCFNYNIECISAETKEFRVEYCIGDKKHFYYPDFYLPEYNIIIEIKPNSLLTNDVIINKINAGAKAHSFKIVDEETLSELETFYYELENYQ